MRRTDMDMSRIIVTTEVRDDDLNDIHIRVDLSGHATDPQDQNYYLVGLVQFDAEGGFYTSHVNDHLKGDVVPFDPERDVRHALDKVVQYLIDFAVENKLAGAESLRVLGKEN
jgi:hypothetical protein